LGLIRVKVFATIVLFAVATSAWSQDYRLPFKGRWFVMQGGDTLNVNAHMEVTAQWYAIDFAKVGGADRRSLTKSSGTTAEDFYSWGEPVLSPVDGEVVAAVDTFPDNPLGAKDLRNPAGNYVEIRVASDRYVFLAHLQHRSIVVHPGQSVTRGETLGKCGNSGNTDFPHVHMHVQDAQALNTGTGQNVEFSEIDVEMTGKQFRNVQWPLTRGLFVTNR
jgi:hypothetical protein